MLSGILQLHRGRGLAGGPGVSTFADGHREIALCEAILKSHREERWIEVVGQ